jgi:hypothetical protein
MLNVLRGAHEPFRLELLLHAYRRGSVHTRDATKLAEERLAPESRTPGYHLGVLVRAGLLSRIARGQYELTSPGHQLVSAIAAFGVPTEPAAEGKGSDEEVLLYASGTGRLLDSVVPPAGELRATVVLHLNDAHTEASTVRVRRPVEEPVRR